METPRDRARKAWLAAIAWGIGVDAREDAEVRAAFEAWWRADLYPPPDARIADDATSWWHGPWLQAGHHLHDRMGRTIYSESPLERQPLDGGFAPRLHRGRQVAVRVADVPADRDGRGRRELDHKSDELPQGQFARALIKGTDGLVYTIISWWDRTQGDTRGNCSACFIVAGERTTGAMLEAFPRHFPKQAARLAEAGVELVEVEVTAP